MCSGTLVIAIISHRTVLVILIDWFTGPKFKVIFVVLSESQVNTISHSKQHGQLVGQMEILWIYGTQSHLIQFIILCSPLCKPMCSRIY